MSSGSDTMLDVNIELPSRAPMVRITAGIGTAGQKTWNLRRPITLIGSRRPAHIVLHDQGVARAHCVIVNTGAEVLLKDLHTSEGTFCNKQRVDLAVLSDGDVICVGDTRIQVAVQAPSGSPDDSGVDIHYEDPTKFPEPVIFRRQDGNTEWKIVDAIALLGRHESSAVPLDHEDISARHAVLFRLLDRPALFDLGSRTGVTVNGEKAALTRLKDGCIVGIGPIQLRVGTGAKSQSGAAPVAETKPAPAPPAPVVIPSAPPPPPPPAARSTASDAALPAGAPLLQPLTNPIDSAQASDPLHSLTHIEDELSKLQNQLGDSWERLNAWQSRLLTDATALSQQETNLSVREAALEARDAELRGQLHDLTRYQEQLAARERELSLQLAQLRAEHEKLKAAHDELLQRESDMVRRGEELQRREHVFAQRWSRLQAAKCPSCGKLIGSADRAR